jgi:hypothetical protein
LNYPRANTASNAVERAMLELSAGRGAKIDNESQTYVSILSPSLKSPGVYVAVCSVRAAVEAQTSGKIAAEVANFMEAMRFSRCKTKRFVGRSAFLCAKRGLQKMSSGAELMSKDLLRHRARATKILSTFWDSKILVVIIICYKIHISL